MESLDSPECLDGLKRADLQKLAKKYGVKANMKTDKLKAALCEVLFNDDTSKKERPTSADSENESAVESATTDSASSATEEEEPGETEKPKAKTRGRKVKKAKTTTKAAKVVVPVKRPATTTSPRHSSTPKSLTPARSLLNKPATPARFFSPVVSKSPAPRKSTLPPGIKRPSIAGTPGRVATPKTATPKPQTPKTLPKKSVSTPAVKQSPKVEKRKRSATPKAQEEETREQQSKRQRRGTFDKEPSPGKRRSRRSTLEKSDGGVSDMLAGLDEGMTDQQMKDQIMSNLDKRVQQKQGNKPSTTCSATSIPRFTALSKPTQSKKPVTPGNKNWQSIHEKEFSKMKSLDECVREKQARTDKLSASLKKIRQMRDTMKSNVESLKSYRTPPSVKKSAAKLKQSKPIPFASPATKPFVPTVTSTSKADFNFTAQASKAAKARPLKSSTPSVVNSRPFVPTITSTSKANFSFGSTLKTPTFVGQRKSPRLSAGGAKENLNRTTEKKSRVTPFKFTGTNTSMNTSGMKFNSSMNTSTSAKAKFDLQASLQKKLTWKPHTGKLKPFSAPTTTGQPNVKTVNVKSKEERRKQLEQQRSRSKHDANMKRRGIVA